MRMRMMQMFLQTLLLTVKLSVTQDIFTVDHVSIQQGKSLIIPCLYNANYINHPKYLCLGCNMNCRNVQKLKQGMVSISDDQTQRIFTVTLNNLTTGDGGSYWCSVKTSDLVVMRRFQLQVTKATPQLYVDDQLVTGYEGSLVVIFCRHQTRKPNAFCKIGGPCVSTTGNIRGASVQLSRTEQGFNVTMSELTMDNTGWYWCSAGDQQMPVHITVQTPVPNLERNSFVWLIFLGLLLAVACITAIVFRKRKQKCKMFSSRKISENFYVSMKKPKMKQVEDEEAQDYEVMSSSVQKPGGSGDEA